MMTLSETEKKLRLPEAQRHTPALPHQFISHSPKSGLNPLVDCAAYLFSVIGKLKQLKSYRHLHKLQKELINEINQFQELAKSRGYRSEYVLVSRYALCATLDDIIMNTPWGDQGLWENYRLLAVFNSDGMNAERFFIMLERVIKDPAQYIDIMELMYLCLSLGFKGSYRNTEFSYNQLEQITHSLYQHIRAHKGDLSKALSPYPIKPQPPAKIVKKNMAWLSAVLLTAMIILLLFISFEVMLEMISKQTSKELKQIGHSILYENH